MEGVISFFCTVLVSTFSVGCASWTLLSTFSTTWTSSTGVVFSTELVSVVLVFWLFTAVSSLIDAAL